MQTSPVQTIAESNDDLAKLEIVSVTEHTRPHELLRLMKSSVYDRLWPKACNASDSHAEVTVNGFACELEQGGRIPSIVQSMWSLSRICCEGECVQTQRCGKASPLKIWEAWQRIAEAEALQVTELPMEIGVDLKVKVQIPSTVETESTGVLAAVEVRMLETDLEFEVGSPTLSPKGLNFFKELGDPLAALVTMQMMAWPDKDVKVLFCPHASTTARTRNVEMTTNHLPQDRAEVIEALLQESLPGNGIALLGKGIGHFNREVKDYVAGREAHIVYKIFDASTEKTPTCQRADLYPFVVDETKSRKDDLRNQVKEELKKRSRELSAALDVAQQLLEIAQRNHAHPEFLKMMSAAERAMKLCQQLRQRADWQTVAADFGLAAD